MSSVANLCLKNKVCFTTNKVCFTTNKVCFTTNKKQPYSPGFPPPDNQTQHTPQEPRQPRERTPVAERVPLRRRQSSPPRRVEVHNDRPDHRSSLSSSRGNGLTKKAEGRQVHFSSDIEYVDDTEQSEIGPENGQKILHPHREQSRRINPFTKHKQEDFENEASYRLKSRGTTSSFRVRPASSERIRGAPRAHTTNDTRCDRPRIIQDGRRQISEAGERICEEARQRQSREDFRRDFPSQASHRRQSRRSDRFQSFNSGDERIVYDKGPRRHGWRWP
ncbi:hypothetical protein MW887_002967 [Aspergillus wentii]|nr:hypothetical protein MW887_002967 [Aspergillus wentii]